MANANGEALAISMPHRCEQDRVYNWRRLAHRHSLAQPLVPGPELVPAIEEKREQGTASEVPSSQRWFALEQLLRVSFGLISPAYLFDSYPPVHDDHHPEYDIGGQKCCVN